mgnify:CR=1 FL=1|jgi:hypothetical protein
MIIKRKNKARSYYAGFDRLDNELNKIWMENSRRI